MSVIFVESFDGVDTTTLVQKGWNTVAGSPTVDTTTVRTGTGSLLINATGGEGVLKGVPVAHEHATFILGVAVRIASLSQEQGLLELRSDSGATSHVSLTVAATGALLVKRGTTGGTQIAASAAGVISVNVWYYIELKATLSDASGVVQVRVDGADAIPSTGSLDTKNAGTKTVFDSIALTRGSVGSTTNGYYDDVYLANGAGASNNDFIGDCKVRLMLPNGNGNSSQLIGSDGNSTDNYLLVDDVPGSTADFVQSGTANQKDTYAFQDLPDGTGTVVAVQHTAYAVKSDAASRSIAFVTRHSGTDYDSSDFALPTPNPTHIEYVTETNPGTGVAWLRSEVNAAEFGVKVRP